MSTINLLLLLLFLSLHHPACTARILVLRVARHDAHPAHLQYSLSKEINDVEKVINNNGGRGEVEEEKDEEYEAGRRKWRVPSRGGEEEAAGFNLDYLPPKTHPPVHN